MDLRNFSEEDWYTWFTSAASGEDTAGVPFNVLHELYPEVAACGPAAVRVAEGLSLAKDFLDGIIDVVDSPGFDCEIFVDDVVLFSAFDCEIDYASLRDEIDFWATLDDCQGERRWNLIGRRFDNPSANLLEDWEGLFEEEVSDTSFFDLLYSILRVYIHSEVCLALGHISVKEAARPLTEKVRGFVSGEKFDYLLNKLRREGLTRVDANGL